MPFCKVRQGSSLAALAFLLACVGGSSSAQGTPKKAVKLVEVFEFRGRKLGDPFSEDSASTSINWGCEHWVWERPDNQCWVKGAVAGVEGDISVGIHKNRVQMLGFRFDPDGFESMLRSLTERWGRPSAGPINEVLQNRMGAKFTNRTYVWNLQGARLVLVRYLKNSLDDSSWYISDERQSALDAAAADSVRRAQLKSDFGPKKPRKL